MSAFDGQCADRAIYAMKSVMLERQAPAYY